MAHKVFICHSSKDKAIADAACAALETHHISCWIAPRDILAGDEYGAAIIDALDECEVVLLIFSFNANNSPQVRREIERAISKGKIIIPFRIEEVLPSRAMEFALMNTQWLDALKPPMHDHLRELCDIVARRTALYESTVARADEIGQHWPTAARAASPHSKIKFLIAIAGGCLLATCMAFAIYHWTHSSSSSANNPEPPSAAINATPPRTIWVATLTSGDLAYTRDILDGFKKTLDASCPSKHLDVHYYSISGPSTPMNDPSSMFLWRDRVLDILSRNNFDYVIGIGTQATMALQKFLGPHLSSTNLLALGVTDPVGIGLVSSFTGRNDINNVAAVAYMGRPEDYAAQVYDLLPDRDFIYMYQRGYPQDETIANRLEETAAAKQGKVRIVALNHLPSIADFDDLKMVYFSWYTFEKMFETGSALNVLQQRIVVSSTMDNVEADNLAAIGVSSSDQEIGGIGARLLLDDTTKVKALKKADVLIPPLHHWVNCRNAQRLGLNLSQQVIASADKAFECN